MLELLKEVIGEDNAETRHLLLAPCDQARGHAHEASDATERCYAMALLVGEVPMSAR